jgi:hypothetical protein
VPYALNPLLMRRSSGGAPTLERPAGSVFSGPLVCGVWSVWLSDPLFATSGHHSFNVSVSDTPTGSVYWEFGVGIDNNNSVGVSVVRQNSPGSMTAFSWASDVASWPTCQGHVLLSFDLVAGVAQAYINDVARPLGSTTPPAAWFTAGVPFAANTVTDESYPPGGYLADLWFSQTPSFVDLSVTANRRKFINADLTPVDLGTTGTAPFGTAPTIYQSIRPGGVAADFLTNRGAAGGTFAPVGATLVDALGDPCVASPPDPEPTSVFLALDDVQVRTIPTPPCQIFLDWSDDRAHSFGSPVGQPMGSLGEYRTFVQWQRLGYARDRVWRLTWSCPRPTALQGGWIELTAVKT